jgi:hypothetical protein
VISINDIRVQKRFVPHISWLYEIVDEDIPPEC